MTYPALPVPDQAPLDPRSLLRARCLGHVAPFHIYLAGPVERGLLAGSRPVLSGGALGRLPGAHDAVDLARAGGGAVEEAGAGPLLIAGRGAPDGRADSKA